MATCTVAIRNETFGTTRTASTASTARGPRCMRRNEPTELADTSALFPCMFMSMHMQLLGAGHQLLGADHQLLG